MQNEPAFPVTGLEQWCGMSLRDWFAGMVIAGMSANTDFIREPYPKSAEIAYKQADAMLAEREKLLDNERQRE